MLRIRGLTFACKKTAMSKRARSEAKEETPKLHLVPGGIELEDALPFSRDLLWLIATYTFPIAPPSLRNEILINTANIRMAFECHWYNPWSQYSLCNANGNEFDWIVVGRPLGYYMPRIILLHTHYADMPPSFPDWLNEYHEERARVEAGKFKCPPWVWRQVCVERHGHG